jgi:ABC-type dipeptide/oligopeptide/nickel transport system permease subunit
MAQSLEMDFREYKPSSLWLDVWHQVRRNRFAVGGMIILAILILVAIGAPWIAPHDPYKMDLAAGVQPPNPPEHILGTDELGRDLLSRLIYGSRVSLRVGLIVVGIAGSIGVTLGAISGYYGGVIDQIIMRLVDVLFAFPFLVLAIAVVAIVGPSLTNMMIVLGCVSWIYYARLVRGLVLSLREQDYISAAHVIGARDWRIIWRHILPNCLGVVIVQATFGVATSILAASGLSFLGMGAQPPTAEWGAMLSMAKKHMRGHPVLAIAPGMAIMITVLAINFVGDALRDALDPRLRI